MSAAVPLSSKATMRRNGDALTNDARNPFQLLCDRSLAGVYVIQDGVIKYSNPALAEMLSCDPSNITGALPLSFVHPDDRPSAEGHLGRLVSEDGEATRFETRCVRADGGVVHVEFLGSRFNYNGQPALMGTMIDITARKRAESAIVERLQFEQLLANLSARFVNLPSDQISPMIDQALQLLVEFLGNDRSTLVEFDDDVSRVLVTHCYAVPSCTPFPLGELPSERLPWFIGQFRSGRIVFLKNLPDDLPPEAINEREYCIQHGLKSNVSLPLKAGGNILGGITFAFFRHCQWPPEIISRLQLIGEVFANALLRRRSDERLRAALEENQRLRQRLEDENLYLREQSILKYQHGKIIGRSDAMVRVLAETEQVAATDAPVLLLGETGTGKELLAQTIHELSARNGKPMVIVNCASLPATLIESELFGREAGAYTGAASAQIGRFMLADGSTLFLDEIGEFPVDLQAKLLRVLQDGRFERLGNPTTQSVDVRILAATNRNLRQAVEDGEFRADLYHRLNVFPIQLPPLRERREDIPQLVWAFVEIFGSRMGKSIKSIPRKAIQQLQNYSWPGNIRELSNVVERAMILTSGDTLKLELPSHMQYDHAPRVTLKQSEREQILRVLRETGWRIRGTGGAAEKLEIKATTLEARMAKLGITRPK